MTRSAAVVVVAGACALASGLHAGAAAAQAGGSLIDGRAPVAAKGASAVARLTDGVAPPDGDFWKTDRTVRLSGPNAQVTFDLGAETTIDSAWLQGDSNDAYVLEVSPDGRSWAPLWTAEPAPGGGMRGRTAKGLGKTGRYVRLGASGGDGAYAVGEVQVFAATVDGPVGVRRIAGARAEEQVRDRALVWGLAMLLLLWLTRRGSSRVWVAALLAAAGVSAARLLEAVGQAWPLDAHEVSLGRGAIAVVAGAALLRDAVSARRPASRPLVLGTLALCGCVGFSAFYGFGRPQFFDVGNRSWTFAHYWDLRQYYPTAKYFDELGYRRMYQADARAFVESSSGLALEAIAHRPMRSLDTFQVRSVGDERAAIETIKDRFSPARWEEYKSDAEFFRRTMGTENYLETMIDFGGNATPVWMGIAHILFNLVPPSDTAFTIVGFVDVLLLAAAFLLMGKAFGARTAFVSMVVFGCNDFIMYGTNWAGAPLRHDWLAYLGIGASLLRLGRSYAAGAFLMAAAMIRAFPALGVVGAAVPGLWAVADRVRTEGRFPTRRTLWIDLRPTLRIAAGAVAAGVVLFMFSAIVLGPDAWVDWLAKASKLNADPHPAHVTLRTLLGGWENDQPRVLRSRAPVYAAAIALYVGLALRASRRRGAEEAVVWGMTLAPVVMYPANYYVHLVYLVPLLMAESRGRPLSMTGAALGACALAMCAASFFTTLMPNLPLHFYMESVVYLGFLLAMLIVANLRARLDACAAPPPPT